MAEMELSILSRQCINRRFDSASQLEQLIEAWRRERNRKCSEQIGVSPRLTRESNSRTFIQCLPNGDRRSTTGLLSLAGDG
jgi:hypothetical protein